MFSQWLGEEDELYKFISAPNCPQEQADLTAQLGTLRDDGELYNIISAPFPQEQTNLIEQGELYSFIQAPCPQEQTTLVQQNPFLGNINVKPSFSHVLDHGSTSTAEPKTGNRRKFIATMEESPNDDIKKIIHRDVERQRRQQMSSLYVNLRSVVPREYLQGKRSISNHINGTIKYIVHMKKQIDGLNNKRNELMKISLPIFPKSLEKNALEEKPDAPSSKTVNDQPIITVITCKEAGRMEITANIGLNGHSSLSKIMKVLHSEGMLIQNCTSTRVHQRMLHIIQLEVHEGKIRDLNELYKKLMATRNIN